VLLDAVRRRFVAQKQIYSHVGDVLVSVNPYAEYPSVYSPDTLDQYLDIASPLDRAPHIFATASLAYAAMRRDRVPQTILVSGESGSGKTAATRWLLALLSRQSERANANSGSSDQRRVEAALVEAGPLLEAFGNAQTLRNDNSSRFGKYIEIIHDNRGVIVGATLQHFLLEKVRVVQRSPAERTFHVFYQLLRGAAPAERRRWQLLDTVESYRLLSGDSTSIAGVDDGAQFERVRSAMQVLGFDAREIELVFGVLAFVLNLGNVTFKDDAVGAVFDDSRTLAAAAAFLGCDTEALATALLKKPFRGAARTSAYAIPLQASEAAAARDALCAATYAFLFDWLVRRIAQALAPPPGFLPASKPTAGGGDDSAASTPSSSGRSLPAPPARSASGAVRGGAVAGRRGGAVMPAAAAPSGRAGTMSMAMSTEEPARNASVAAGATMRGGGGGGSSGGGLATAVHVPTAASIGILDVFGFESLAHNSLEQLLINYANERLQALFTDQVLRTEQDEYAAEGIAWQRVAYRDNAPVLALLEQRPRGAVALLDEECMMPAGADTKLREKFDEALSGGGDAAVYATVRGHKTRFDLRHFAGVVRYDVDGWLEKNRDALLAHLEMLMLQSPNAFVRDLFLPHCIGNTADTARSRTRASLAGLFRRQLSSLLATIAQCGVHHVRCVPANATKTPAHFDSAFVLTQLRQVGVLEAVAVRRSGFALRRTFAVACRRYMAILPPPFAPQWRTSSSRLSSYLRDPDPPSDPRAAINALVTAVLGAPSAADGQRAPAYFVGKTKIFLSAAAARTLDSQVAAAEAERARREVELRRAREDAERKAREEAERARIEQERLDAERRWREEQERLDAERRWREEQEALARAESERREQTMRAKEDEVARREEALRRRQAELVAEREALLAQRQQELLAEREKLLAERKRLETRVMSAPFSTEERPERSLSPTRSVVRPAPAAAVDGDRERSLSPTRSTGARVPPPPVARPAALAVVAPTPVPSLAPTPGYTLSHPLSSALAADKSTPGYTLSNPTSPRAAAPSSPTPLPRPARQAQVQPKSTVSSPPTSPPTSPRLLPRPAATTRSAAPAGEPIYNMLPPRRAEPLPDAIKKLAAASDAGAKPEEVNRKFELNFDDSAAWERGAQETLPPHLIAPSAKGPPPTKPPSRTAAEKSVSPVSPRRVLAPTVTSAAAPKTGATGAERSKTMTGSATVRSSRGLTTDGGGGGGITAQVKDGLKALSKRLFRKKSVVEMARDAGVESLRNEDGSNIFAPSIDGAEKQLHLAELFDEIDAEVAQSSSGKLPSPPPSSSSPRGAKRSERDAPKVAAGDAAAEDMVARWRSSEDEYIAVVNLVLKVYYFPLEKLDLIGVLQNLRELARHSASLSLALRAARAQRVRRVEAVFETLLPAVQSYCEGYPRAMATLKKARRSAQVKSAIDACDAAVAVKLQDKASVDGPLTLANLLARPFVRTGAQIVLCERWASVCPRDEKARVTVLAAQLSSLLEALPEANYLQQGADDEEEIALEELTPLDADEVAEPPALAPAAATTPSPSSPRALMSASPPRTAAAAVATGAPPPVPPALQSPVSSDDVKNRYLTRKRGEEERREREREQRIAEAKAQRAKAEEDIINEEIERIEREEAEIARLEAADKEKQEQEERERAKRDAKEKAMRELQQIQDEIERVEREEHEASEVEKRAERARRDAATAAAAAAKEEAAEAARREAAAKQEALERAKRDAERSKREMAEQAKLAAIEQAKRDAVEQTRREAAEQIKRETEQAKREAEAAKREAEAAKREAENAKREAEAAKREAAQQAEQARREAAELAERTKRELAEQARREAAELAERTKRELAEQARREAAELAERTKRELAEQAKVDAAEKARLEAAERAEQAKRAAEAADKARRDDEERARAQREAFDEKRRREEEERVRVQREAADKAKRDAEERRKQAEEAESRKRAEEAAKVERLLAEADAEAEREAAARAKAAASKAAADRAAVERIMNEAEAETQSKKLETIRTLLLVKCQQASVVLGRLQDETVALESMADISQHKPWFAALAECKKQLSTLDLGAEEAYVPIKLGDWLSDEVRTYLGAILQTLWRVQRKFATIERRLTDAATVDKVALIKYAPLVKRCAEQLEGLGV
jgi:hypothetical protein